ncbi:MAG: iron-containing alcohol dehydrogenase [Lachnospiraceae bacterium]|jgi:alcohol dehydrogenase YqhD (iron-dependent ADH family)|nr:iron-containing alcohol dehydrogenase [Lachnospiraceae bacterium]
MKNFTLYTPTRIVFGKEVEKETGRLAKEQGASKVLIVYGGGSIIKSGLLKSVQKSLQKEGIAYTELAGVKPNPRMSLAREGVEKAISFGADLILAVGGGSSIDTAKAIAIGAANEGIDLREFWSGKEAITKVLPVGAVLTIAAAGSEMSDSAVLTNEETGKKGGVNTDLVRPRFAVMNPELTYTLPKYQLTCGIVDIFMHTIERYFTPEDGNELTDEIAEGLLRTLIRNGLKAVEQPKDYDALSEIMWCGSLSHNNLTGLGRPKDFACHKLGHEIGGMFDEAHGATLSAVWGSWARYVYQLDIERFANYGKKVWNIELDKAEEAAIAAIEKTEEFFRALDMPVSIGELSIGVQPDEVLKKMAESATKEGTVKLGCFKRLDMQDMYEIYKIANH